MAILTTSIQDAPRSATKGSHGSFYVYVASQSWYEIYNTLLVKRCSVKEWNKSQRYKPHSKLGLKQIGLCRYAVTCYRHLPKLACHCLPSPKVLIAE